MIKSYNEPLFLLLKLRMAESICEISDFIDIEGELGDYDGGLTEDGDDL